MHSPDFFLERNRSSSSGWEFLVASEEVDVLLAFMPFGSATFPSLGLSLLKAGLQNHGISSLIAYYNLVFAGRIGIEFYVRLFRVDHSSLQLGEWVFSQLAFAHSNSEKAELHNEGLLKLLAERGIQATDHGTLEIPKLSAAQQTVKGLARYGLTPQDLSGKLIQLRQEAGPFVDSCVDHIVSISPKILGFSTGFCQVCSSLAVARRVKERLGAKAPVVIFGGSSCEGIMGYTMLKAFSCIDYVCTGEGDRAFIEFAARFLSGTRHPHVQGIIGRSGNYLDKFSTPQPIRNMDELPFPDFRDYFVTYYAFGMDTAMLPFLSIETSRGCWWGDESHCIFCGLNGLTMKYRSKTPGRILKEFGYLAKTHGSHSFLVADNIPNPNFLQSVFSEFTRKGLKLDIRFRTRSNLKREQIQLMREVGVREIQPGIENLSDEALRLMRKGVTGLENVQLLEWCREMGMRAAWNWLWGVPGENPLEYERMRQWIPLLHHLQPPDWFVRIRLDRFSPLFDFQKVFGICNVRASLPYRLIYPLDESTLNDLAYHFDYDYEDGREPDEYAAGLAYEILRWRDLWRARRRPPILSMLDMRLCVVIYDTRPCATRNVIVLVGIEADIYRHLVDIRTHDQLIQHFTRLGFQTTEIQKAISNLIEKKLVLVDSDRCLALACDASAALRQRLPLIVRTQNLLSRKRALE